MNKFEILCVKKDSAGFAIHIDADYKQDSVFLPREIGQRLKQMGESKETRCSVVSILQLDKDLIERTFSLVYDNGSKCLKTWFESNYDVGTTENLAYAVNELELLGESPVDCDIICITEE